jgi:hypothetical protein
VEEDRSMALIRLSHAITRMRRFQSRKLPSGQNNKMHKNNSLTFVGYAPK